MCYFNTICLDIMSLNVWLRPESMIIVSLISDTNVDEGIFSISKQLWFWSRKYGYCIETKTSQFSFSERGGSFVLSGSRPGEASWTS